MQNQSNAGHVPADAGFETVCVHFGEDPAGQCGAATPPIYQSSTFLHPDAEAFETRGTSAPRRFDYTRVNNPTTAILTGKLARLEKAEWCYAFGSGMGAISATINACVHSGAHVVAVGNCYGPTRNYLKHMERFGVETTFVSGLAFEDFEAALQPSTKLVYLESPTSGCFEILPVRRLTDLAKARGILTAFDNSWATPYFQNPLELGVDLVVHSATKYINGHSDVVAGVVMGRDELLRKRVQRENELVGATLDPFAAWLMLRGLRTLAVRMEYHQRSGLAVAEMLANHPRVKAVHHPGLTGHPQHELAAEQLRGYSALFSLALKDEGRAAAHRFLNALKLFGQGVSWGGHESLAIGGSMFSRHEPGQEPAWLIRLSIGLESTADLIADLKQALEA